MPLFYSNRNYCRYYIDFCAQNIEIMWIILISTNSIFIHDLNKKINALKIHSGIVKQFEYSRTL